MSIRGKKVEVSVKNQYNHIKLYILIAGEALIKSSFVLIVEKSSNREPVKNMGGPPTIYKFEI